MNAIASSTHSRGVSIFLGVLLLLAGLLSIAVPFFAGIAASVFFGWLILLAGVAHLVYAWSGRGAGAVLWQVLIGIVYVIAALYMLVLPVAGVLAFEVLLNASSLFNHSNVAIAPTNDALMRLLICTPDMHRVHHSIVVRETNSNFGFNLPWWDRLFGTYCSEPAAGQIGMTIGLEQFREADELGFIRMLIQPWRKAPSEDPINRA